MGLFGSHQARGDRVLELPQLDALRQRIDDQSAAGDEARLELLLAVMVRTDGGDKSPRPYVLESEEVGASCCAGGADIGAGERRCQVRRRLQFDAGKLRRELGRHS
jgi:hypothetical protein